MFFFIASVVALDNGLARTPQMGWNPWNAYGCNINESIMLQNARYLVSSGLKDIGYEYLVMDDCWSLKERQNGSLVADPSKFPRGIKEMSDEIHGMGLKFGMYGDAGAYTCGRYPGSLGHETIDAETFAGWGVDYLKYDNCFNEGQSGTPLISYTRYKAMSDALLATGREILYSMCNWGDDFSWNWLSTIANSGRMSGDVTDSFDRYDDRCPCESFDCIGLQGYHCSFMNIIEKAVPIEQKAQPGAWLDMDILEVGNGGSTYDEYVTQFSMWALLKSPLLLGNDLSTLTNETMSIIANTEIIAVNQDAMGSPVVRVYKSEKGVSNNIQIFSGTLSNSSYVVAILNAKMQNMTIQANFTDIFLDSPKNIDQSFVVRDLWSHTDLGRMSSSISASVPAHGTRVFKLTDAQPIPSRRGDL